MQLEKFSKIKYELINNLIVSDGRYHEYRIRYDTDYFFVKVSRYRLPKRLLLPIFNSHSHLIKSRLLKK